jgi:iron complex transport system ATP-binding protein
MDQAAALQTQQLSVGYGKGPNQNEVLHGLDLKAESGQLIALIGANGTGKSTLIRTLAGLQSALGGEIRWDGVRSTELSPRQLAARLSIVLTDRVHTGYLTVMDLVAMGRHPYTDWRGRLLESDKKATDDALQITGLWELKHTDLHELSDGQLQKVMIARAVAQDGPVMLLDEPLIHLDIPSKWEIMNLLKQMTVDRNKTVLLATHELELGLHLADRIWLINKQRRMLTGTPEELIRNQTISETFNTAHYTFNLDRFKPSEE